MNSETSWGKPLTALLGALKMQVEMGWPSIGGKDSMSGTFQDINVPPMLMAFGITTVDARTVISPEFKAAGHKLYMIKHTPLANYMPDTDQLKRNFDFVSSAIEQGKIVAAYAVGFGGVVEAVAKMSFGNCIGADVKMDEQALFDYAYGSFVVEATEDLSFDAAEVIGQTVEAAEVTFNGEKFCVDALQKINSEKFCQIYPDRGVEGGTTRKSEPEKKAIKYTGAPVEQPIVYLPAFVGTNCDYDTAKAFERAGAKTTTSVFCDLTPADITASIEKMKKHIDECHILALSGGFSAGDEPDGSGKFIVNVLNNKVITDAIHALLDRGGLILGICNGFQALVKSGLLPYGRLGQVVKESPTLFRNDINRHISQIVSTRVATTNSPWLSSFELGEQHSIAVSHGEGKFVVSDEMAEELFANGQVAFQYVDPAGEATLCAPYNPNGSSYGIEGIISANGQILGKMGHTERFEENLFKNIHGNKAQGIFANAVNYFKGE
jgi:phosphoribosylformylglycinamidine synthase